MQKNKDVISAYEELMRRFFPEGPIPQDQNLQRFVVIERDINDPSGFRRISSHPDLAKVDAWIADSSADLFHYEVEEVWDLNEHVSAFDPLRHSRNRK